MAWGNMYSNTSKIKKNRGNKIGYSIILGTTLFRDVFEKCILKKNFSMYDITPEALKKSSSVHIQKYENGLVQNRPLVQIKALACTLILSSN